MNDIDRFEQFTARIKRRGRVAKGIDLAAYALLVFSLFWQPGRGDADLFMKLSLIVVAGALFFLSARILRQIIDERPPAISAPWLDFEYDGKAPASEFRQKAKEALKNANRPSQ